MSLTLYTIMPSRGIIAHWMLEEVGQPYELKVLDGRSEKNRQPEYLKVNPMGKVPALVHDGVVITEAAAICCYLADRFPQAGLNALFGDQFTAADVVIGAGLQWAMQMGLAPRRDEFVRYSARLEQRPAWQRVAQQVASYARG